MTEEIRIHKLIQTFETMMLFHQTAFNIPTFN